MEFDTTEQNAFCEHQKIKRNCSECNLTWYLVNLQRNNLRRILKSSNTKKIKSTLDYLGCGAEYFKNYIQSKMTAEMTWENIHLDHIKPINSFNLEDHVEFLECCHYTNFQPLLAADNLSKSDNWSEEDDAFWRENICGQEYLPLYMPVSH